MMGFYTLRQLKVLRAEAGVADATKYIYITFLKISSHAD